MYGITQIKSEYDPVIYMDAWSYQRRYFDTLEEYFPEAGERVEIYIGILFLIEQRQNINRYALYKSLIK